MKGLDDYLRLAEVLAKSELVPQSYRGKPADIVVAMGMGAELGLSPFNALQALYVIGGKPNLYVEAAIAIVRASGELERLDVEGTEEQATCVASRRGQGEVTITFTLRDAQRLGLKGGSWISQPGWMLQCRAIGRALHRLFPDLLRGVGVVDPSGRPVEQADVAPATAEEPAPISGGSLAALTARLSGERPVPEPAPEPAPEPEPEPEPAASGPSETEIALKRSWIIARRDKLNLNPQVWLRLLRTHAGVDDLGAASLDGLDQLTDALGGLGKKA
jgi:hypothetical protein